MTIQALELAMLRENTKAFIDTDYKDLTFSRRSKVPNGSGGFTEIYTPLPSAQRVRLIPQHGNLSPQRETLDGTAVVPEFILLAEHSADLARWDTFVDQGMRYQVLWVHEKKSYEVKGEVKYLGSN